MSARSTRLFVAAGFIAFAWLCGVRQVSAEEAVTAPLDEFKLKISSLTNQETGAPVENRRAMVGSLRQEFEGLVAAVSSDPRLDSADAKSKERFTYLVSNIECNLEHLTHENLEAPAVCLP